MSGPDPIDEWIAICADQHAELERLRAEKAELVECLLYARAELIDYEHEATGETYNNTRINLALAKAKEASQ